jgi:lipase maturation factor
VASHFQGLQHALGAEAWLTHPSVFWLGAGDAALQGACWLGAAAAIAVVANRFTGPALLLAWVLYLSLYHAGQLFMDYQWDLMLLESGFLGRLLSSGSRIPLWLLRWLLFRFMFLSGAVKLASGDPAWTALRAIEYHFETQPLPTPLAWYAHQLPSGVLSTLVAIHFVIELALPFLVFLPRRPRLFAAGGFLALQGFILATGNFGFFNLLTLALLVPLLEDATLRRVLPARLAQVVALRHGHPPGRLWTAALAAFAVLAFGIGTMQMVSRIELKPYANVLGVLAPFRLVNSYGVFANMLADRREIAIEGSDDGTVWRELVFRYKPGPLERAPPWNIPHQPRLDWQMWFAAIGDAPDSPWLVPFFARLLDGSAEVIALTASPEWVAHPPRELRAILYRYRFATPQEHAQGLWWRREPEGEYLAPVTRETVADTLRRGASPESLIRWR